MSLFLPALLIPLAGIAAAIYLVIVLARRRRN